MRSRLGFMVSLIAVFCSQLQFGDAMHDVVGLLGLVLAFLFGIAPYRWKDAPKWLVDIGLIISGILIGIFISQVIEEPPKVGTPPSITSNPDDRHISDSQRSCLIAKLSDIKDTVAVVPVYGFVGGGDSWVYASPSISFEREVLTS